MKTAINRDVIDILIVITFVALLLWIGMLAWGAYSQHSISLLINASVLADMKAAIQSQVTGVTPDLKAKTSQEIARLQDAQEKLFDANTASFNYQFVTLIILTIGTSILALIYNQYRREEERADKAEEARKEILSSLAPFVAGQDSCVIVSSKYSMLYMLCYLYSIPSGLKSESSRIMMADYQTDILKRLEDALQEKEGFEPLLFKVILDMAERVNRIMFDIRNAAEGAERDFMERVLIDCQKCYDILWTNGKVFKERYDDYWLKMTGKKPHIYE
jgi:hypothetical protein